MYYIKAKAERTFVLFLNRGIIMIISASRRTDIPAFFSGWFMNRIREQYALVRNPFNSHQVSKISLNPDVVDCIVFWSKNPGPMLTRLNELQNYTFYFQYTLNAYGREIEMNLPALEQRIETFQSLSKMIGKERIIWRYDPIILNETYTADWHISTFSNLAGQLSGYTRKCTISFIDMYPTITNNVSPLGIREMTDDSIAALSRKLSSIAASCGLVIDTCAEKIDLSGYNIRHGCCIDGELIAKLAGCPVNTQKDKNQRPECRCAASIDLGFYNTCRNGCLYCYANHSRRLMEERCRSYDSTSPLLCSRISEYDRIYERKTGSLKNIQYDLFNIPPP